MCSFCGMRRVDDDMLETNIAVAIKTAPKTVKQGMRSKLTVTRDKAVGELAKHIVKQISNDSTMVVKTDLIDNIGCNGSPGRWGEDEPDPTA